MTDGNFYTAVNENKLITDPLVAKVIASIEAKLGPEEAQKAEQHLYESGPFNLGQEKRVLYMNELEEKFPDAFKTFIDSKGRKFLLSKQAKGDDFDAIIAGGQFNPYTRIFLSAEGCGLIRSNVNLLSKKGREKSIEDLQTMKTADFTPLLDKLSKPFRTTDNEQLSLKTNLQGAEKKIKKLDLLFLEWDILGQEEKDKKLTKMAFQQLTYLQQTWVETAPATIAEPSV